MVICSAPCSDYTDYNLISIPELQQAVAATIDRSGECTTQEHLSVDAASLKVFGNAKII